jgi:hypothetical protein
MSNYANNNIRQKTTLIGKLATTFAIALSPVADGVSPVIMCVYTYDSVGPINSAK